ncbi:hypothetical protein ARMSODRAFT_1026948 [Armillaria solidipes]|uniref:Uncharacterized protein n=1 Tax=Armillaria solidipes TaxID=1076256 RepID=A0A2H3ATK9_9AGAR|nr:hypothetical protein ARMSODRAFT_1026948 [Armillaria solidipes]
MDTDLPDVASGVLDEMDLVEGSPNAALTVTPAPGYWRAEYEKQVNDIAQRLTELDRTICCAFAYKVSSHTTDKDFAKLPHAFPTQPAVPSLDTM